MDGQSGSMHYDGYLSKEVAYFTQHGKNPVQQDRQENLLPEKDIVTYMEGLLKKETNKQINMAHDLLTRESPEIIRFFQDIGHITELLKSEPDRYRPVLNGDRYITETELSELLKITRRTLVEHRTTGLIPYYRLGGRILYKEKDIIKLLDENRLEAF